MNTPVDSISVTRFLLDTFGHGRIGEMSPKERVKKTIRLQKADRVPFDYYAVPEMTDKLMEFFQLKNEAELLKLLGVDMRVVYPDYIGPQPEQLNDGSFYTEWGHHRKTVKNEYSEYQEYASFPLAAFTTAKEIEEWDKWPKAEWWDWSSVPAKVDKVNKDVPYHIRFISGGIFEMSWGLMGMEEFLIGLYTRPEVVCSVMDCYTNIFIESIHQLMKYANGKIDMICTFDDVATQRGLMISEELWRKYILPFHSKLNMVIKRYELDIMYHSCGAVQSLVEPLFKDMHIDVLNPLQYRAKGMGLAKLKEKYGSLGAFYGGVDIQHTLPFGTPEDVKKEVDFLKRTIGKGGGYICASAHHIQADTPVENLVALYTADRTIC